MKARHAWSVLERAGVPCRCAFCYREYELEVDHISGDHYDDRLENLRFLCRPCHLARHGNSKYRWWKPEDWVHCDICGKLCLRNYGSKSGPYVCPACSRKEIQLVESFAEKYLETDLNAFEPKDKVYFAFVNFCIEEGFPKMNKEVFEVRLRKCVLVVGWYENSPDKRAYCWRGIRLKNFGELWDGHMSSVWGKFRGR